MEEKRIKFLTDNLDSKKRIRVDQNTEVIKLGKFCKSHLDLLNNGNSFVKGIAAYRVSKVMEAVNSSNSETKQTSL